MSPLEWWAFGFVILLQFGMWAGLETKLNRIERALQRRDWTGRPLTEPSSHD